MPSVSRFPLTLALALAGAAAQATGYHLVLAMDAAHKVMVCIEDGGLEEVMAVAPGNPLPIVEGKCYFFQFKDRLGADRKAQEVSFDLFRTGVPDPVSRFRYASGLKPQPRIAVTALEGAPALEAFRGTVKESKHGDVSWRNGKVHWWVAHTEQGPMPADPTPSEEKAEEKAEERKTPRTIRHLGRTISVLSPIPESPSTD